LEDDFSGREVRKEIVMTNPATGARGVDRAGFVERVPCANITGKKNADGSIAVQFGDCDGKIPDCLPIMKGWNCTMRLCRPRTEIVNGNWKFPEPQPAS
jgi:hypothetical protein